MPTTIEIAKLIEKEHYIVRKDTKSMLENLGLPEEKHKSVFKRSNGLTYPCYHLSEREALILMMSYSTVLRARVVDKLISFTGLKNIL